MERVVAASAGVVVIAAVVAEVFQDLFHPARSGALSGWIGRRLFNLLRRHPPLLPLAGPLSVVLIIAAWVLSLGLGFAFIYYGWFPAEFRTSAGSTPPAAGRFLSSLYFSFATLITLGYGDLVPHSVPMRFAAACEGLMGFGLLTASVSSIVLLFPALARMRLLARGVEHVVLTEGRTGMRVFESSEALLAGLAREVTSARTDLIQFPILYYFATGDQNASLARWAPELARLAKDGLAAEAPKPVRFAAATLDSALDGLASLLAQRFLQLSSDDREEVFRAFAEDHALTPRAPGTGQR